MTVRILAGGSGTQETDDDFNLVTALLHADGSNGAQNNTLLDSSSESHTVTRNADIVQGTFSPFSAEEGKWSTEFAGGTGQTNLTIPNVVGTDFVFGTGDYTVEAWVFPRSLANSATTGNFIIDFRSSGNTGACFVYIGVNGSGDGVLVPVSGNAVAGITLNAWNHIAVARESSTERTFINGVLKGSNTNSTNFTSATATIGSRYAISNNNWSPVDGFISNLRVVKGTAVYTSAFTPSTSPLTAITNTKLLTCCSNRFRDKSTTAHSFTANGTPKIQPFSPFAPSSSYSASNKGGSGYFDQSSDCYLTVSDDTDFDFGTGNYTLEAWVYPDKSILSSFSLPFGITGGNNYWGWTTLGVSGYDGLTNHVDTLDSNSGNTADVPRLYEWTHLVYQVTSGNNNWYVNGVRVYNATAQAHSSAATGFQVGRSPSYNNHYYGGYISDVRVIKGYNAYSNASTLTVPTAPLTAVSYTKLLLNFTNAAMFDQTGKTNIDTVGNAQLDTSVKKFGTASAEFDGNGDRLVLSNKDLVPFGTQSFTIECFIYVNANKNYNGIYSAGVGIQMYVNSSGKLQCWLGNGSSFFVNGLQSTSIIPTSTWRHIALVRDSSANTVTWYIEGLEKGQQTSVTDSVVGLTTYSHTIGSYESGTYSMNGYIDEFRITNKARYTSNFTAPTKEFPNN